jgi:transposase
MIRVEAVWLCTQPMDMRAGTDTTLARVVQDFGSARPHKAYVFANKRSTRLKWLVHEGIGIWLAARRLHQGRFIWPGGGCGAPQSLKREQLDRLGAVTGLWQASVDDQLNQPFDPQPGG